MPEQKWIADVLGDETRARGGFEDELARELHREWQGRARQTPWRAIAWGAAAAAVLVGGNALIANDNPKQIAPADTLPSVVTTEPAPTVTDAPTTIPDTTPDTTTEPTSPPTSTTIDTTDLTGVALYLASLANGDYDTAARLLNEGGLSLEDRADIRPLFRPEFGLIPGQTNRDAVAAALERWCARALCIQPASMSRIDDRWVAATFTQGELSRTSLLTEYVFEGQEGVTGLPPMMAGAAADPVRVIDCPTESVRTVAWADLDGDGWIEQLVAQATGDPGEADDNVITLTITTCGTALQVEPLEVTGDGLALYSVNTSWVGPDYVLIGFLEGIPSGGVYAFDDGVLVQQQGPDGPATWAFAPPVATAPDPAESFGCAITAGSESPILVNRFYRLIGGIELSNSSSMELTSVDIFTGATTETTFDLPEQQVEAGDALIGYCNDLPVQAF